MKPILPAALLAAVFFFSSSTCFAQKKPVTALDMNEYLVSITDTLYETGREWGTKFTEATKTKNYASLATVRKKLESFIERKQLEVITLKDIGGSEKLRLAMLDMLFFESRMIQEGFKPVEKLNNTSTQEDINKTIEQLSRAASAEEEYLAKVRAAQNTYAAKNGFTISDGD